MSDQPQQPTRSYSSSQRELSGQEIGGSQLRRTPARTPGSIKYGSGKFANVELIPQPSNLPEDPLNWSPMKKNLHFATLLMTVGTLGTLKTILVTVNAVVATEMNVSYGAAVALTGLPIIFGAGFSVKSRILAKSIGKRGIQVASALVMLLAAVWNMHVVGNYAEFMISRIFQGIGWGMFEGLMNESISDLYFEHERSSKTTIYNVVSLFFTWGSPILGGYLSQNTESFRNEIMILNIIQSFAIVFLIFLAPETTFHRDSQLNLTSNAAQREGWKAYLQTLKPTSPYSTHRFEKRTALRSIKALATPSAIFATLLTAPLVGTAFGIAHSLSLLFAAMPTFLFPSRLGYIFALPLAFTILTFPLSHFLSKKRGLALPSAVGGIMLAAAGILAFGMYTTSELSASASQSIFTLSDGNNGGVISLKVVSALFGLLVAGSIGLKTAAEGYIATSSSSSSPSSSSAAITTDLITAHQSLQEFIVGIWTIATPIWIEGWGMMMDMNKSKSENWMGLRGTSIGLAVTGIVVGSTVAAGLWVKGRELRVRDEMMLGRGERDRNERAMELGNWEKGGSGFFEG